MGVVEMGKGAGAVERFPHPKVWSPAGGWWCNPANWKGNTKKCGMIIAPVACVIFAASVSREERPVAGRPMPYLNLFGRGANEHARLSSRVASTDLFISGRRAQSRMAFVGGGNRPRLFLGMMATSVARCNQGYLI